MKNKSRQDGDVVEKAGKPAKYVVNWRGTFSLYFSKFYFVVLVGRDLREVSREVTGQRREKAYFASNFLFFLLVGLPYALLLLIVLYFLKQMMGIDIFPGIHMPNVIRELLTFSKAKVG